MIETAVFALEVIHLSLIYYTLYRKRIKNLWIPLIALVIYFVVFVLLIPDFNNAGKMTFACIMPMAMIFFLVYGKRKEKSRVTLVIIFVALILEQCVCVPFNIIDLYFDLESKIGNAENILISLTCIGLLMLFCLFNRNKEIREIGLISNTKLYVLVIIMVIEMLVTSSGLNYARYYVQNRRFDIFSIIMVTLSYLAIGILGLFVVYIRKEYAEKEAMLHNEILLKEIQKSYYETLLQKEEETRRYRHDMSGHLLCLSNFVQEENMNALKDYLQKMRQQMRLIQCKDYATGNQVIDAITNHYLESIKKSTKVTVIGQWEDEHLLDNVTLCTIYSNLLKNAVEELERGKNTKKILNIIFLQGEHFCGFEICNSISVSDKEKTDFFMTDKENKKQHGLGLKNVKRAVKECGGKLELSHTDEFFTASFTISKQSNDHLQT